ncbi:MAG TPA: hypothetical protein VK970_07390 [Candidatus Methylacidiphilales bacterium]|nr:hypothetical protein [Candidatus Methylacidiphilales bacterium]
MHEPGRNARKSGLWLKRPDKYWAGFIPADNSTPNFGNEQECDTVDTPSFKPGSSEIR